MDCGGANSGGEVLVVVVVVVVIRYWWLYSGDCGDFSKIIDFLSPM